MFMVWDWWLMALLKADTAKLSSGANQGMAARITPSDPELDHMEKDMSCRRSR